jgi:Fur family transcriptional regulator, ferric uptake regulator
VTIAHDSPGVVFADVDGAIDHLRQQGRRVSLARRLILEALFAADGPASADELAERAHPGAARADLASVYRNLDALERAGIVRHVHLGHGPGLYALAGGRERAYLHCERCGRVDAVKPDDLDDVRTSISERFGYHARFTHFPIVGLCEACASTPATAPEVSSAS